MRAVWVLRPVCLAFVLLVAACSGAKHKTPPSVSTGDDDGGTDNACIDNDGDGYGENCALGTDCNDNDPTVTDQCRRCGAGVVKDCPCKPGTKTVSCTPPVVNVAGGVLVCHEGNRYCRDGYWGDCETIGGYVFEATP
jgi:hypothetical protein